MGVTIQKDKDRPALRSSPPEKKSKRAKPKAAKLQKLPVQDPAALEKSLRPLKLRERLATLRSMFNLSQEEASLMIGRKRNAWSNWEAEEGNPRRAQPGPTSRAALAYTYSLPASLFVDG